MPKRSEQLADQMVKDAESLVFPDGTKLINMAIYAILELPQELYFGLRSEKNRNLLETVKIQVDIDGRLVTLVKPYFSPTKQRGLERRAIAYAPVGKNGRPYYRFFNLSIDVSKTYPNGKPDPRDILTWLWGGTWTAGAYLRGRIAYGGGVGVQALVEEKERNRVEYNHHNVTAKGLAEEEVAQTLWSKEYAPPHLLVPVVRYGYLLGVENYEPHAMAYAFINMQKLAGAGTPKTIVVFETFLCSEDSKKKLIVVDIGKGLLPEPVTISPAIVHPSEAVEEFKRKALSERHAEYVGFDMNNPDESINGIFEKKDQRGAINGI